MTKRIAAMLLFFALPAAADSVEANALVNPPAIAHAVVQGTQTRVVGTLRGRANRAVLLDFFRTTLCGGGGETYIGSLNAVTNAQGNLSFDTLVAAAALGAYVTATASDGAYTSELSSCRQVISGIPSVGAIAPAGGRPGTTVTITGTAFTFVSSVKFFNGSAYTVNASFTIVDDHTLTTIVPAGAKIGPIRLSSQYGFADTTSFRVTPPKGDLNGDGSPDLIWRTSFTGDNFITLNDGTEDAARVELPTVNDPTWQIQGTGDFNNDGHHDILWRFFRGDGPNRVWLMNGTTYDYVDAVLPSIPDLGWHIAAVGDFDGDGDPDLVIHHHASGMGRISLMNGTEWSGRTVILPTRPVEWRIEAAGDFDLDGATDLLWRNATTGENVIWHMNGTSWSGVSTPLPAIPDPDWVIEAAVDWDRDGDLDIVWRNIAAGSNVVWLLVGAYWDGFSVVLPPRFDPTLHIEDF